MSSAETVKMKTKEEEGQEEDPRKATEESENSDGFVELNDSGRDSPSPLGGDSFVVVSKEKEEGKEEEVASPNSAKGVSQNQVTKIPSPPVVDVVKSSRKRTSGAAKKRKQKKKAAAAEAVAAVAQVSQTQPKEEKISRIPVEGNVTSKKMTTKNKKRKKKKKKDNAAPAANEEQQEPVEKKKQQPKKKKPSKQQRIKAVNEYFEGKESEVQVMREMIGHLFENEEPEEQLETMSKTKLRRKLRSIHIHIEDYVQGKYEMKTKSFNQFRKRVWKLGPFPKKQAKSNSLQSLLRTLAGGR